MGGHRSWAVPLAVLTTAVVVGAGAFAFGPARSGSRGAPAGSAGADGQTVVRTGMAGGYQTPPGTYRVDQRATREWSHPYHVWLPYWQDFDAGIGFHETTTYLHNGSIGSHGCVNLLPADAVALWGTTATGTTVKVFGRRPGT